MKTSRFAGYLVVASVSLALAWVTALKRGGGGAGDNPQSVQSLQDPAPSRRSVGVVHHGGPHRPGPQVSHELAALAAMPAGSLRTLEIVRLVAGLDPAAIVDLLATLGPNGDAELRGILLQRWVDLDPSSALAHVMKERDSDTRAGGIAWMIARWGENSLPEALVWMESLKPGPEHNAAAAALAPILARSDRAAAVELIASLPQGEAHVPVSQVFRDWAIDEAGAAFDATTNLVGTARFAALDAVLHIVAAADPAKAVALWESLPASRERADLLPTVARHYAQIDAHAATEWAAANALGLGGAQAVGEAFVEWAHVDPAAACQWADSYGSVAQRDALYGNAASALAGSVPLAAIAMAQAVSSGDERRELLRSTADVWRRSDSQSFWTWLFEQRDGDTIAAVVPVAVDEIAASDPAHAATWVEHMPSGEVQAAAVAQLVSVWSATDPAECVSWALGYMEQGEARTQALGSSLATMLESAPARLDAVVSSISDEPERDSAVLFAVERSASRHPERALQLAEAIRDPVTRTLALQQAFMALRAVAPSNADAWLDRVTLPSEAKAMLRSSL